MILNAKATGALLRKQTPLRPSLAMVLGSGFQHVLSDFEVGIEIPYGELSGFPTVGVTGHAGKLVIGKFGSTPVAVLKGRAHFYEGHTLERVTFPIRVLAEFGVRAILLTNAAGGIKSSFRPGDFMVIEDHINLIGTNPLRGLAVPGVPRFVDLTEVYSKRLRELLRKAGKKSKVRLHHGIYIAVSGPSYETPAEIRAFARLGADAVGMSTVPEAIVARQCGMEVAGISCITNAAAGRSSKPLSHSEVLAMGEHRKPEITRLLNTFTQLYAAEC
jgi:purine-nucleoside phosphorylase